MKIVTYNINGIRASAKLGLLEWVEKFNADVYCFQEVRCDQSLTADILFHKKEQLSFFAEETKGCLDDYHAIYNCGEVAGYAGTLILTKQKPDNILYDMGEFWTDKEGRTTTIICGKLAIVNAYIPNGNSRLEFKMQYLQALNKFLDNLNKDYEVICVGDFNIAHNEIDLTNPKECKNKSVFLPMERQAFSDLLNIGMIDCFRYKNPNLVKYSWRSYRSRQDTSYNSWQYRIDYILASQSLGQKLLACDIMNLEYSDHLPVVVEVD